MSTTMRGTAVHCWKCERETSLDSWGRCLWCHHQIEPAPAPSRVDVARVRGEELGLEDGLAAGVHVVLPEEPGEAQRKLLGTLGATYDVLEGEPAPKHLTVAPDPQPVLEPEPREEIPMEDLKAEAIAAIQEWTREHGEPPSANEWKTATPSHACASTIARHFGSWAAAIEAAGFPRPTRGGNRTKKAAAARATTPAPVAEIPHVASNGNGTFASKAQRLIEVHAAIAATNEQLLDLQAEAINLVDDLKAELG